MGFCYSHIHIGITQLLSSSPQLAWKRTDSSPWSLQHKIIGEVNGDMGNAARKFDLVSAGVPTLSSSAGHRVYLPTTFKLADPRADHPETCNKNKVGFRAWRLRKPSDQNMDISHKLDTCGQWPFYVWRTEFGR